MTTLTYTIDINAPKTKVWDLMLGDKSYRHWTSAFQEGSYYEGSWDAGSSIRFLAPDEDGTVSGLSSRIAENIPHEYISVEHVGEIIDGREVLDSEGAKQWAGGHENYTFTDHEAGTRLVIELEARETLPEEIIDMFDGMWPPALQKLKEICEHQ